MAQSFTKIAQLVSVLTEACGCRSVEITTRNWFVKRVVKRRVSICAFHSSLEKKIVK